MTDAAQLPVGLRLEVAIAQLVHPEHHDLARDPAAVDAELTAVCTTIAHQHLLVLRGLRRELSGVREISDPTERAAAVARVHARITAASRAARDRRARAQVAVTAGAAVLPSLLAQLTASITNSSNGGPGGNSPASHRSPVALAALELVTGIQAYVGCREVGDLYGTLPRWAAQPHRTLDDAVTAEHWVTLGRSLLTPPRGRGMPGACPHCKRVWAYVDDAGERVRRHALEVTPDAATESASTRCLGCGTTWPPARAHLLAAALEQQAHEDAARRAERKAG